MSAWDDAAQAAELIPVRGNRYVRVTRMKHAEFIASATVTTADGPGVVEVAVGVGTTDERALRALIERCHEKRRGAGGT